MAEHRKCKPSSSSSCPGILGALSSSVFSSPPSAPFLLLLSASLAFSKGDCQRLSSGPVKGTGQDTKAQPIFMYLDKGGLKGAVSEWSDLAPWLQCNTVVASPIHFLFREKKLITKVHFFQYKNYYWEGLHPLLGGFCGRWGPYYTDVLYPLCFLSSMSSDI